MKMAVSRVKTSGMLAPRGCKRVYMQPLDFIRINYAN